jgi:agmatine/peptidylarginine deiminase
MKKIMLLFLVFSVSAVSLFAQSMYNEDGIRLYHTPSQEELEWAKSKGITVSTIPTAPPVGELRPIAEWEPAEAVLISYPFGIPMSLIIEMAKETKVITIVTASQQSTVISQYNSAGVNMANCEFLDESTNTYWTRDYGPWFMAVDNNEVLMFDFTYNRPRPLDNQINTQLANQLSINRYASTLQLTGGNFMNDGMKQAASTTLTLNENSGWTTQQIKDHFQEYMGIEPFHFIADAIYPYDNIQHIDCWGKYLAPDKVLVDSVAPSAPNFSKFEAAAAYFASLTSSYGTPMKVYRVFAPGATSSSPKTPYSNSLILNNKVYVPIGGNQYDAAALQVYQQAMPGYTIFSVPQLASAPWVNTDALHCRTHEIADRCMLYIKHQPLFGNIVNTGSVTFNAELYSYCNNTIYPDSALIYIKHSGGAYQKHNMVYQGDNAWQVTVAGLPSGLIEYYVFAADDSGRRECHPYIGAPDPHKFTLTGAPPDLPLLAIDKISSLVVSEAFSVIEDEITVSNVGTADLIIEITDIEFPNWLAVSPLTSTIQSGGSQVITLSYDFAGIENGEYKGRFKILSNDPLHQVTEVSLTAIQNVTEEIPVMVLDKTSSSVYSEELAIVEDYITVSNVGNADLIVEVGDIDFDEMLTISPHFETVPKGESRVITLSYNFNNVAKVKEYSGSFILLSNDPLKSEVEITCHAELNLSINETDISGIRIYPNPAGKVINVYYDGENTITAHICNVLGQNLKEIHLTKEINSIDIQELPNGVYFIKIGAKAYKFVKR